MNKLFNVLLHLKGYFPAFLCTADLFHESFCLRENKPLRLATALLQILLFCHQSVTNQLIFVTNRVTNCSEALKHTTNYFIGKIRVVQPYVGANACMIHLTSIKALTPFPNLMVPCVF